MKRETVRWLRELASYSTLGLTVAFSIFIGLFFGIFLDHRFDTNPWMTLIGLGFGIAAGFSNIIRAINKSREL